MEIGDPADLEVRIEVLSRTGVAIRPGARVLLEQWAAPSRSPRACGCGAVGVHEDFRARVEEQRV